MDKVTVSDLEELTGTEFFRLLSNFHHHDMVNENLLADAYKDFLKTIVNLCINSYLGTPAYFVLKYVRIELCQLEQCYTNDKKKSGNLSISKKGNVSSGFCFRLAG